MLRRFSRFVLAILLIEFLDEFVFGAREAAWPLIRDDLALSYAEIGILLSVPGLVSNAVEPLLAVLGEVWRRKVLVLGGGVMFTLALLITTVAPSFAVLLAGFILMYPASGAFVSLSQATLMDLEPERREQNMARWTFAGSLGVVGGPLALAGASLLGWGWRGTFVGMMGLMLLLTVTSRRMPYPDGAGRERLTLAPLRHGLGDAVAQLREGPVLRWLVLLQFSDLMMDVLLGFLALYFVDVGGTTPAQAGMAVAVWTGVGLAGDLLLIPLLERVKGLNYLRISAVLELLLLPAMLLAPTYDLKLVILGALGFFNSGWYAILQAQLYAALPGRSGTALAVNNLAGLVGSLIPLALGLVAQAYGLTAVMWLLLAGPVALLIGLPRRLR
jgi:MFS transporter, FSR family, fosmidomycin resistance protein